MTNPFSPTALQAAVAPELDKLVPDGKTHAFSFVATADGIKAVYAVKLAKGWELQSVGRYDFGGDFAGFVSVQKAW